MPDTRNLRQRAGDAFAAFRKTTGKLEKQPSAPKARGAMVGAIAHLLGQFYADSKLSYDRNSVVEDAVNMYNTDDRVEAAIDGLGEDANTANDEGDSFRLEMSLPQDTPKPQQNKIEEVGEKLREWMHGNDFFLRLDRVASEAVLRGDRYEQVVVDWGNRKIDDIVPMPDVEDGYYTWPMLEGNRVQGYQQKLKAGGGIIATFAPWELLDFQWGWRGGRYGRSLLKSARRNWKRLDRAELDMAIARAVRAYMKIIHEYPDASEEDMMRMIQQEQSLEAMAGTERGVRTDYYTTGKVEVVDPSNAQLVNINDVEHSQRKLMASLRRPPALMGGPGQDVNRAMLDRQTQVYYEGPVQNVRQMLETELRPLLRFQLLLWGYPPDDYPFVLHWTMKHVEPPKERRDGIRELVKVGILDRYTARSLLGFDPAEIEERMKVELGEEEKRYRQINEVEQDEYTTIVEAIGRMVARGELTGEQGRALLQKEE